MTSWDGDTRDTPQFMEPSEQAVGEDMGVSHFRPKPAICSEGSIFLSAGARQPNKIARQKGTAVSNPYSSKLQTPRILAEGSLMSTGKPVSKCQEGSSSYAILSDGEADPPLPTGEDSVSCKPSSREAGETQNAL